MLRFDFPENLVPPDRLRFKTPDGHIIEAADRNVWYSKIRKHYADNSIYLPENYKELAQHQLCLLLPPGWCVHEDGRQSAGINTRLDVGDYFRGMEVLARIALSKDPLVSQEVAEERAAKCAACPANIPVSGCLPCMKIPDTILTIKGANETKADHVLKTCAVCRCSCQAHVWVKAEILANGVDEGQLRQMEEMPDCWKAPAIRALNNQ